MNVLLLTSHAIAEHDDLDMFTRMGVSVYSIGGAYDQTPFEGKRPAIANVQRYPDLEAATNEQRARLSVIYGDPGIDIDWAKARLAPEVVEWADTIIVHHFPEQWIGGNWAAIRDKRVIWRTCGQSDPRVEMAMYHFRAQGMQIVRYSPMERSAFAGWGAFAGEDACIRFGKDPSEWTGWRGEVPVVGNITQHMAQRGDACGYDYWTKATKGLSVRPAGPGSEAMGGIGSLDFETMKEYLRSIRVYLYTGTRPASYTLGLIEAMMTGVPVVAMGPSHFRPSELFESHRIGLGSYVMPSGREIDTDDPADARYLLAMLLANPGFAAEIGNRHRARAIEMFGLDRIMHQWAQFLGHADVPPVLDWSGVTAATIHPAVRG